MTFNSIPFALFLPFVFVVYWILGNRSRNLQNLILLSASYTFYAWWNWRFLFLLLVVTLVNYTVGSRIDKFGKDTQKRERRIWLIVSLVINLGILGFFKYFNFFIESFAQAISSIGLQAHLPTLRIILPLGISFYTFQSLTYPLDIYFGRTKATKDLLSYLCFVSFFPQLLAGPIGRASLLLPQFQQKRSFDLTKAKDGLRQMLWGFFKKIVIADNLAGEVDKIFSSYQSLDGLTLALGVFFFAIEIYSDFSGYSDIALGAANLFNISLMRNFAFPYFSRDIGEFWRRWHISLTSWFRDYLYFRIGGLYGSKLRRVFNVVLTFTASGLWHGANWTYLSWGFLNGLYFIPMTLKADPPKRSHTIAKGRLFPNLQEFSLALITFLLVCFAWIFFRAESITQAFHYIGRIFTTPYLGAEYAWLTKPLIITCVPLLLEWPQRTKEHALQFKKIPVSARWGIYILITLSILIYGNFGSSEFFYFQF